MSVTPPLTRVQALSYKLYPPAAQPGQLSRPLLCERICRAQGQLVLVTAPAGFGKTTALRQAHAQLLAQGVCCLWLTLEGGDNDTARFMASLEAAIQLSGLPSRGDAIRSLIEAPEPFALFLDEVELLADPAVLALLRELVAHLPAHGRVLMGSRTVPAIGLGRLRVRGQLTEIDTEALRFALPEVVALFNSLGLPRGLDAVHLTRLHSKTEGWVAALWLAHRALMRAPDPQEFIERFSGSNRDVADYLTEDVLAHQPPQLRSFLLRTSLLRQLNPSVCAALNPQDDAAALLAQLDAQQLFLTPVDGDAPAWRYHKLFADFLRNQLQRECPAEVTRLHLAASAWYESQDRPVPAIDHAIEGGDLPHALSLIAVHAEALLEQGRMRLLARWFDAIPGDMLHAHPRLEMVAIWSLCLTRGPWEAMARLDSRLALPHDPVLQVHAKGMRVMFLAMQDRYDEALEAGQRAMPELPTGEPFADATLLNAMAHVSSVFFGTQTRQLLAASRLQQGSASNFNRMYTEASQGMLDLMQGQLQQATERFQLGLSATHAVTRHHVHGNAWAGVLYAYALYEANQLSQAEHLLNIYLPLARDVGLPDHMILSHVMGARLAQWRGNVDTASQLLAELETLGHRRQMRRVVVAALLERAHLAMTREQGTQAAALLVQAEDEAVWARERRQSLIAHETQYLQLAQLRWQLAFADAAQLKPVLQALKDELAFAQACGRQRRAWLLRVLQAVAHERMGHWREAQADVLAVLAELAPEGHVRLLYDEGPLVARVLRRLHRDAGRELATQPQVAAFLDKLIAGLGGLGETEALELVAPCAVPNGEPLTQRERQVLQLLVDGYSNSAMAENLFLSDSTVRTHLRSINAKLGARSRTHAVALARKAGLV